MPSENPSTLKAALFPIPDMVTFPGTEVPLHVFEPRYRAMIRYCVDHQMMLAIAHTRKIKSKGKSQVKKYGEVVNELNRNQTSYEPHKIFSAGNCNVINTTEDGRIHIRVKLTKRLQIIETNQHIPFQIATCKELVDQEEKNSVQLETDRMHEIYKLLLAISEAQSPELHKIISQTEWKNSSPKEFSFKVFEYFRFQADFMQHVLEQTSVSHRLDLIWQGITQTLQK